MNILRTPECKEVVFFSPRRVIVSINTSIPYCATHVEYCNSSIWEDLQCMLESEETHAFPHLPFGVSHLLLSDKTPPLSSLPSTLTHITFGNEFDQPVDNLPPNLTHLVFKHHFNHPVDHLPHGIVHLTFGRGFNYTVDHLPILFFYYSLGKNLINKSTTSPQLSLYSILVTTVNSTIL